MMAYFSREDHPDGYTEGALRSGCILPARKHFQQTSRVGVRPMGIF